MFTLTNYTLTREVLIDAICSIDLLYQSDTEVARVALQLKLAVSYGGFAQDWKWDKDKVAKLTDEQLYWMYYYCKEATQRKR